MTNRAIPASPRLLSIRTRTALAASLLGLLLGAPAVAAAPAPAPGDGTILVPTGDLATTGVSGRAGLFLSGQPGVPAFLSRLVSFEKGDRPCKNDARYWFERPQSPRNPVRETKTPVVATSRCSASPGSAKTVMVPSAGGRQLDGSVNTAAGVQVCMNAKRTRVKGIRLLGANISATGQVTHSSAYDAEFTRPNCTGTWETARRCASDRVATGVRFHYIGDSLTGIALECQRVEVRTLAVRP